MIFSSKTTSVGKVSHLKMLLTFKVEKWHRNSFDCSHISCICAIELCILIELFGGGWRKGGVTKKGRVKGSGVKARPFRTSLYSSPSCGTAPPADCVALQPFLLSNVFFLKISPIFPDIVLPSLLV